MHAAATTATTATSWIRPIPCSCYSRLRLFLLILGLVVGLTVALAAIIALSATTATVAENLSLEEVIVTAQKKAASVNDVPITMTALGESDIKDLRLTESTQIQAYVSNIDIKNNSVIFLL